MSEPLGGKDEIQNQIRHFTETKTTIGTQLQDLRNPTTVIPWMKLKLFI